MARRMRVGSATEARAETVPIKQSPRTEDRGQTPDEVARHNLGEVRKVAHAQADRLRKVIARIERIGRCEYDSVSELKEIASALCSSPET